MKKIISFLLFLITLQVGGCASVNHHFDCPNKAGVLCKSLDEINEMVDAGEIQGRQENHAAQEFPGLAPTQVEPVRTHETVQRVWVAPYEDSEGNFHEASLVYMVMDKGQWIKASPKEASHAH